MLQSQEYPPEAKSEQIRAKTTACNVCRQQEAIATEELKERMPDRKQRAMKVSAENGASSWFSTLPIADHGFALSALRSLQRCPLTVLWLKSTSSTISLCLWPRLTIEHALSCSRGRVQSIRHNEIRDMTVDLMSEVCYGVSIELCLQAVTEKQLMHKSPVLTTGLHNSRRHGSHSNSGVQEAGFSCCGETWQALWKDSVQAKMSTKLLPPEISDHVSAGFQLSQPPS